ncbi:serine--tRNA ligase [Candidatus Woesearchaeota archaeon]|nr:serine--tRNA ligase [Candidatus Woesearchaeota archaeon]
MLDIRFIRENQEAVRGDLKKRNDEGKVPLVGEVVEKSRQYWELKAEVDRLRNRRNIITREINELKKEGLDISGKVGEAKELPGKIRDSEKRLVELQERVSYILMRLPNVLHESVPEGADERGNVEVKRWGAVRKPGFELKPHGELLEELGLADFKRAAKISGSGFYFLKGDLLKLELALVNYAIDFLSGKGFTPVEPPLIMGRSVYEGVTALQDFENVMYKIDGEDSYLIATSEHPIAAMYSGEVLDEFELPVRLAGFSSCFRREIGSHGVDTRGLFRVHQFNKVEQFVFCRPSDSWRIFEDLLKNAESIFQKLKIPYRVVSICAGDIGSVAAKKYDIEAWFPREQAYREVVSCSNCTSYQSVSMNIRYRKKGSDEKEYVHTLNSTAVATSRTLRAIVENCQNKDGSIKVPAALVPYMKGVKVIGKAKNP